MNALSDLIKRAMSDQHLSLNDVARESGLSRSTIAALRNPRAERQIPRAETLEALAKGLHVEVEDLRNAAAKAAGYAMTSGQDEELTYWIAAGRALTEEQREKLLTMARTFFADYERENGSGDPPAHHAGTAGA